MKLLLKDFVHKIQAISVVISSMSAIRGMPKHLTAYGASKAGVAALAEGIALV